MKKNNRLFDLITAAHDLLNEGERVYLNGYYAPLDPNEPATLIKLSEHPLDGYYPYALLVTLFYTDAATDEELTQVSPIYPVILGDDNDDDTYFRIG